MRTKQNLITREMVVKANASMVTNRKADTKGLPPKVITVIRDTKFTREELNRAYDEARRNVEACA